MKDKLKKLFEFLKMPNLVFTILSYCSFFVALTIMIIFSCLNFDVAIMSVAYGFMGVTFFYCCYLFIRFDFKKIRLAFGRAKEKLANKSKFFGKLFYDTYFRTILSTSISLFLGVCFVVYNAFAGIHYSSIWNGSISVYYALLVGIRVLFLISEYKLSRSNAPEPEVEYKRAKTFTIVGILLICVNVTLIAPVTLIATIQKDINLPMWVAIANACYVFYKVTVCIMSFVKSRKYNNFSVKAIKNMNLTAACVTLLSLENTMIITFSDEIQSGMKTLVIISALAVTIINMYIAISTFINGKKELNKIKPQNKS